MLNINKKLLLCDMKYSIIISMPQITNYHGKSSFIYLQLLCFVLFVHFFTKLFFHLFFCYINLQHHHWDDLETDKKSKEKSIDNPVLWIKLLTSFFSMISSSKLVDHGIHFIRNLFMDKTSVNKVSLLWEVDWSSSSKFKY